jgi:hypothetical protein
MSVSTTVQAWLDHILLHADAEISSTDPSQVTGMLARHAYVSSNVSFVALPSTQLVTSSEVFLALRNVATPGSLRASFQNTMDNGIAQGSDSPQGMILEWIGRNSEGG